MTHEPIDFTVAGALKWNTLPDFIAQLHAVSTADSDRFLLDLSKLDFCQPIGTACLAAGMDYLRFRQQECVRVIRPESTGVDTYLERIGLFEALGEPGFYPYQRRDSTGRFVELTRIATQSEVAGATTAVCDVFARKFNLANDARATLDTILSEIVENVFHHAHSEIGAYLCCQGYNDSIDAAIVDLGDGMRRRLMDTTTLREIVERFGGPLRAALQPGVTSKPAHNSGYGLALTSEMIRQNGGLLGVHSQRDRLHQKGGNVQEREIPQRWPGTAIALSVSPAKSLDMGRIYDMAWPTDETDDLDFLDD